MACGINNAARPPPIPPVPPVDIDRDTFLSEIKPVLQANCALSGCHDNTYFESADGFLNSNAPSRIINGSMPPSYSPKFRQWTDDKRSSVLDWYDDNM